MISQDNWQVDYYTRLNPETLRMEPVLAPTGEPVIGQVDIGMNQVYFKAWRVNVGRCPAYLLDTNLPQNEQHDRDLTLRVYGGARTTRLVPEKLRGLGGGVPVPPPGGLPIPWPT